MLTDIIEDDAPGAGAAEDRTAAFLGEIEAHLATAIHDHADELVHNAAARWRHCCSSRFPTSFAPGCPSLIAGIIEEHFRGPAGAA